MKDLLAYTARFSTGATKSIAKSTRVYAAAWLITVEYEKGGDLKTATCEGFARDRAMAEKAMHREMSHLLRPNARYRACGYKPGSIVHSEIIDVVGEPVR